MSATAPVTISIPTDIIQRLDQAAERAGMSRSQYIISWLPETHDTTGQPSTGNALKRDHNNARKRSRHGESLASAQ